MTERIAVHSWVQPPASCQTGLPKIMSTRALESGG
jgi:hypothetical protein